MPDISESELSNSEKRILTVIRSWLDEDSAARITEKGKVSMTMELSGLFEQLTGRTITPVPEWVSVTDRLPECTVKLKDGHMSDRDYLVVSKRAPNRPFLKSCFNCETWQGFDPDTVEFDPVTHWLDGLEYPAKEPNI